MSFRADRSIMVNGDGGGRMAQVSDRVHQLRDEVADGLAQLVAVATEAGSTVGEESRERAVEALHALRGHRQRRWRWLLLGATLGFAAGLVVARAARRDQPLVTAATDQAQGIAEKVRDTAGPVADAAGKVRDKLSSQDTDEESAQP